MRLIFKWAVALLITAGAMPALAQITLTPVQFPIVDLTGSSFNRTMTLTPLDGTVVWQGNSWSGVPFTLQPVPNGCTNMQGQLVNGAVTNLVGGNWRITYQGIAKASQIYVPFGFTNGIVASDPQYLRNGIIQVFNIGGGVTSSDGSVTIHTNLGPIYDLSAPGGGGGGGTNSPTFPQSTNIAAQQAFFSTNALGSAAFQAAGAFYLASNPAGFITSAALAGYLNGVSLLNATNLSGIINATNLPAVVTVQGNTFNNTNLLVKLDGQDRLPSSDGSLLTNLPQNTISQAGIVAAGSGHISQFYTTDGSGNPGWNTYTPGAPLFSGIGSGENDSMVGVVGSGANIYATNAGKITATFAQAVNANTVVGGGAGGQIAQNTIGTNAAFDGAIVVATGPTFKYTKDASGLFLASNYNTIYLDATNGSDTNSGMERNHPVQTVGRAVAINSGFNGAKSAWLFAPNQTFDFSSYIGTNGYITVSNTLFWAYGATLLFTNSTADVFHQTLLDIKGNFEMDGGSILGQSPDTNGFSFPVLIDPTNPALPAITVTFNNVWFSNYSDVIYHGGSIPWTQPAILKFTDCDLNSSFDCVSIGNVGTTSLVNTNTIFDFRSCKVTSIYNTNLAAASLGGTMRGIYSQIGYVYVNGCSITASNGSSVCIGIQADAKQTFVSGTTINAGSSRGATTINTIGNGTGGSIVCYVQGHPYPDATVSHPNIVYVGDVTNANAAGFPGAFMGLDSNSNRFWSYNASLHTNLNGSSIASGTVADARLSGNVALLTTIKNGIQFTNGSGQPSQVGPDTAPGVSGISFYGTNSGSGNAYTDFMDLTGSGLFLNFGGFTGSGITNLALIASQPVVTDANKALASSADISAFALSKTSTNDTRALTFTGPVNMGIANVTNNITNLVLTASQPVVTDANKALASSADISAFALSKTSTNDTRALTLTGPVNMGIANVTNNITNLVLTASQPVVTDANKALASSADISAFALSKTSTNDTRALTLTGPVNMGVANVTNNITNLVLTASQPVVTDANKALASSSDISAFALSKTSTNDTRALTFTGPVNMGIANVTNNITNLVLTASQPVVTDANKALASSADISAFALSKTSTNDTRALTLTGPVSIGTLNVTNPPVFNAGLITNVNAGSLTGGVCIVQWEATGIRPGDTLPPTWSTNTPGLGNLLLQSAGPSFLAWQLNLAGTNNMLGQVTIPANYGGGAVTCEVTVYAGTNFSTKVTNVWAFAATTLGSAMGTVVPITNNLPITTGVCQTNFQAAAVTIGGTPKPGMTMLYQLSAWCSSPYWTDTNNEWVTEMKLIFPTTNAMWSSITVP